MQQYISQLALLVKDYDEAISFYSGKLLFSVVEDTVMSESKRWVVIAPPGNGQCRILLARAVGGRQEAAVGNQSGGRVFLFMYTDDIDRDIERMTLAGVSFVRPVSNESFGRVTIFADLYGNLWDLIEPR